MLRVGCIGRGVTGGYKLRGSVAVDVMTHPVIGSPMVQHRGAFVVEMPDAAWFDVNMIRKDLDGPTNDVLTTARGAGLAEEDFAINFEALRCISGGSGLLFKHPNLLVI